MNKKIFKFSDLCKTIIFLALLTLNNNLYAQDKSNFKEETLPLPDPDYVMEIMEKLQGCTLAQRTPERVAHRRADKIRRRKVIETSEPSIEVGDDGTLLGQFDLRCESGTYVKETVHGDGGRTQPSIASLIKAKCTVEWLDVADIHAD